MKAIIYTEYGSPNVLQLQEIDKPTPNDNEVLIKVHATTVSSGDTRLRKADPFLVRLFNGLTKPQKMTILGNDVAGEVVSVGSNITEFKDGNQVFGQSRDLGTNAEYICLTEDQIVEKPFNITYQEAAAIPFGGNTALHFLKKGDIQSGHSVLIYGASGSVGTAAVQLAKHFGADVTGICSTANIGLVKSLGADRVIDYTKEDFTKYNKKYDIIFDTVGKSPFAGSVTSLKDNGKYLRAVHMSLSAIFRGLWTSLTTSKKVIGGVATGRKEHLVLLKELTEAGKFNPVIDRTYPLNQTAEAHRYVDNGHKKGNVVISVDHLN